MADLSETIRKNVDAVIKAQKMQTFIDPSTATDEEALGIVVSHRFEWSGEPIVNTFLAALEDANFHTLREKIIELARADGLNI
jgi:hypothetical protein